MRQSKQLCSQVDILEMGLFFNITSASWLASGNMTLNWEAHETVRPDSPNDGAWWIPDVPDLQRHTIRVRSVAAMVDHLLRIPEAEVARRLEKASLAAGSGELFVDGAVSACTV